MQMKRYCFNSFEILLVHVDHLELLFLKISFAHVLSVSRIIVARAIADPGRLSVLCDVLKCRSVSIQRF